jgi:hypothetical protein
MRSTAEVPAAVDPDLFVSAVYALLVQGRLDQLEGTLTVGQPSSPVEVCVSPL